MRRLRLRTTSGEVLAIDLPPAPLAADRAALAVAADAEPVRLACAAAHVVWQDVAARRVDWQRTTAFRQHLAAQGFAVAEAMDTAQRFELGWPLARQLIEACAALRLPQGFVAGAGADQLARVGGARDLVAAAVEQAQAIESLGGEVILLPLPWLSQTAAPAATYVEVYAAIIERLRGPVYLHWLGEAFLPALRGYFPGDSFERIMALAPEKVRGAKLSLLDPDHERALRRQLLARDQIVLTGDDLHFAGLIGGDGGPQRWTRIGARRVALGDFSHALLGAFDATAEPAGLGLRWLARGDRRRYHALMDPAEALARVLFEPPVRLYKAGLAFLAWLNGHQDNFSLLAGDERGRSRDHYLRVAAAAAAAGVLRDAERAEHCLQQQFG